MKFNRRLFEKTEGLCDHCSKKFKIKKGYICRNKVGNKIVCCACKKYYYKHGTLVRRSPPGRRLFEKTEGLCDHCSKELKGIRCGANSLVVCISCYNRHQKRGTFERLNGSTYEVKNTICNDCKKKIKDTKLYHKHHKRKSFDSKWYCVKCYSRLNTRINREKANFLKNMPPEELIKYMKAKEEEK